MNKELLEKALSKMLEKLDYPDHNERLSTSIVAVLINEDKMKVSEAFRNIKKNAGERAIHAECLCIDDIGKENIDNYKYSLVVTSMPCIDCFDEIINYTNIKDIYILKDYQSNLIRQFHYQKYLDNDKFKDIKIHKIEIDSKTYRRIIFHYDASMIKQIFDNNISDLNGKNWWHISDGNNVYEQSSHLLSYIDTEKIMLVSKYLPNDTIVFEKKERLTITIKRNEMHSIINSFLNKKTENKDRNISWIFPIIF